MDFRDCIFLSVVFQLPVVTSCKHMVGIAQYRDRDPGSYVTSGIPHNATGKRRKHKNSAGGAYGRWALIRENKVLCFQLIGLNGTPTTRS